jgi:hypothetical protein
MKAFLYAGAALMASAIIYGLTDYKASGNNSEFKNLYKAKQSITKENLATEKKIEGDAVNKTSVPVKASNNENEMDVQGSNASTPNNTGRKSAVTKKKKILSYKLFSRAALDERYIVKTLSADSTANKASSIEKH